MRPRSTATLLAITAAVAACARTPREAPAGAPTELRAAILVPGDAVPPGRTLEIELLDALSTETSARGVAFRAFVRDDLVSLDGALLAPRGAIVYGTVSRVAGRPVPHLALDLEVVRTARGDAPIEAKLLGAEPVRVAGVDAIYDPAASPYDAVFTPSYSGFAAPGESVLYEDYYDERAGEIVLPVGAVLRLVLRRPLAPTPRSRS